MATDLSLLMRTQDDPTHDGSSAGRVAAVLRDRIVSGVIVPGARLREEVVSAEFNVGRYTVRTAIRKLVTLGLLMHEPNRGASVPRLTAQRIEELWEFRSVLELGALSCGTARGADLGDVPEATAVLLALPPRAEWLDVIRAHQTVHLEIVRLSGNDRLVATYAASLDELEWVTSTSRESVDLRVLQGHHRRLLTELEKDPGTALAALRADLEAGLSAVFLAGSGRSAGHARQTQTM